MTTNHPLVAFVDVDNEYERNRVVDDDEKEYPLPVVTCNTRIIRIINTMVRMILLLYVVTILITTYYDPNNNSVTKFISITTTTLKDQYQLLHQKTTKMMINKRKKKKPIHVRIYLESLCIDSQRYMFQQIIPTYMALYGNISIMNLQIIVFGNSHYIHTTTTTTVTKENSISDSISNIGDSDNIINTGTDTTTRNSNSNSDNSNTLICQHGIAECDTNNYNLCVQYVYQYNINRYLPYMECLFDGRIPMGYNDTIYSKSIYASCAKETGIDWTTIYNKCYLNTSLIQELQYNAYIKTKITNHTYVPWVTLNGQHLMNEDETNLLQEILNLYNGNS